jgi:hypothetical protein
MIVTASARAGATVTLTATVAAANGTTPAGSVLFETGGAVIGSPVAVTNGRAATAVTFAGAAEPVTLSAVFSAASTAYLDSSSGYTVADAADGQSPPTISVPRRGMF